MKRIDGHKLNIQMMAREAIALLANIAKPAEICYLPTCGAGTKVGVNSPVGTLQRQRSVEFIIEPKDFIKSLDDFAEKYLMHSMTKLWGDLKEDQIAYTHTLVCVADSAFNIFDGFAMRGMIFKKIKEGVLPSYKGESEESIVRFDVLYSRAID